MKKTLIFVLLLALMASLFVPFSASAKDGELLIAVNFLTDTFHTENRKTAVEYNYSDKYDLSQTTSSMLFATKKEGVDTDTWNADLHYVEDTGYYVTNDTKYTIYFEAASAHYNKWSGVTFLRDPNLYNALIILMGAYSDDGDNKDADGNRWSELLYAYDYGKVDYALGSGYNSKTLMQFHPALVTEILGEDKCQAEAVTEFKFSTIKIELDGLNVTTWYLDAENKWARVDAGQEVTYQCGYGSEIVLGAYTRNEERHGVLRNMKLLQGVGLSLNDILNATQTTEPKPAKPETTAAPETTKKPVTTKEPETTKTPETTAAPAATTAPTTEKTEEKSGCGSVVLMAPAMLLPIAGALLVRRKKED